MARKKKKQDFKTTIRAFFNSAHAIVCGLLIIIVILLWFCSHLMSVSKTYMFNGKGEYVSIYNGIISLNYDVNVLIGSDISYIAEKDLNITKYEIGYFVRIDKKDVTISSKTKEAEKDYYVYDGKYFIKLVAKKGEFTEGLSLKGLLLEEGYFNTWEPYQNKTVFPEILVKYLDSEDQKNGGLYFIINATLKNGTEIHEEIKINVTKVSK